MFPARPTKAQLQRTFCHHCAKSFEDIWALKLHQDKDCPTVQTLRRSRRATAILAGLSLPAVAWLAQPSYPPPTATSAQVSTVPAGPAEATVAAPVIEIGEALVVVAEPVTVELTDDQGFTVHTGEHEAAVAVTPPTPEPEACFASLPAYLAEWDARGVQPATSCIEPYAPAPEGAPGTVPMVRDPEWDAQ